MPTMTTTRRILFVSGSLTALVLMWVLVTITNHNAITDSKIVPSSRVKILGVTENHVRLEIEGATVIAGPSQNWRTVWVATVMGSLFGDEGQQLFNEATRQVAAADGNCKISVRRTCNQIHPYAVYVGDEQVEVKVVAKASWLRRVKRWIDDFSTQLKTSSATSRTIGGIDRIG